MPAFNPRAGFSPNCCAVLVQTEHWAFTLLEKRKELIKRKMIKRDIYPDRLMVQIYEAPFDTGCNAVKISFECSSRCKKSGPKAAPVDDPSAELELVMCRISLT